MSGQIRMLVDRSKDACIGDELVRMIPTAEFQTTDNRKRLNNEVLGPYDVLTICGQSLRRYTPAELGAVQQFVDAGGGLLLAADMGFFELEANAPADQLAQNQVAELFGARFLSADC